MRLHTLILALFVFGARAATILEKAEVEFDKKLDDVVKEVLSTDEAAPENASSEHERIDQVHFVKDVENNLRKGVQIVDIPVKVVVEEVKPSLKSDCKKEKESNNEVAPESEDNIKRVEIDLKNPGLPQRTQHDTQNPEHFEHQQPSLSAILRQSVIDTQNVFNNGVQSFQENLQNWWTSQQQFAQIQQNLEELQQNFQGQIDQLNSTVQKYWPSDEPKPDQTSNEEPQLHVESGLKMIETNFKAGVKSLADGVHAIANVKVRQGDTSQPSGPFNGYFQQLQQQISLGFQNMTTMFQSYFNQSQEASNATNIFQNFGSGVQGLINSASNQSVAGQADEGVSTSRPTIWQSFQNIFNPQGGIVGQQGAQADTPVPNRPILNAIQNIIQPNKPAASKPETQKPEAQKPEASQEGTNQVPVESKPEVEKQKQKPEIVQNAQSGPIKQMLIEKNPIVQGIAGAVQRIQHTIANPEKPRDTDKQGDKGDEKGGLLLLHGHGGHGGHGGWGGHGGHGGHGGEHGGASGVVEHDKQHSQRNAERCDGRSADHPAPDRAPADAAHAAVIEQVAARIMPSEPVKEPTRPKPAKKEPAKEEPAKEEPAKEDTTKVVKKEEKAQEVPDKTE